MRRSVQVVIFAGEHAEMGASGDLRLPEDSKVTGPHRDRLLFAGGGKWTRASLAVPPFDQTFYALNTPRLVAPKPLSPLNNRCPAATLEIANRCNSISATAWREQTFSQFKLHKLVYADTRARSGLSAQVTVRVIAKVADAYKLDHTCQRNFASLGSLAYDDRILRYHADSVSIWSTAGRQTIPFVCGQRQRGLLSQRQGESDLVYRDGQFLYATWSTSSRR
jgi:hypothetical protein